MYDVVFCSQRSWFAVSGTFRHIMLLCQVLYLALGPLLIYISMMTCGITPEQKDTSRFYFCIDYDHDKKMYLIVMKSFKSK